MTTVSTRDDVYLTALRPTDAMVVRRWLTQFLRSHNRAWVAAYGLGWSDTEVDAHIMGVDLVDQHWSVLMRASKRHERHMVAVARVGDRPVGLVWAGVRWHDYLKVPTGALQWIFVDPAARGGGIGSLLVEHAKDWMRERDLKSVEVNVLAGNEAAQALYRRAGLVVADVRMMGSLTDRS